MSRNGSARIAPALMTLIRPPCSTTNSRPVLSRALVTKRGRLKPPAALVRVSLRWPGVYDAGAAVSCDGADRAAAGTNGPASAMEGPASDAGAAVDGWPPAPTGEPPATALPTTAMPARMRPIRPARPTGCARPPLDCRIAPRRCGPSVELSTGSIVASQPAVVSEPKGGPCRGDGQAARWSVQDPAACRPPSRQHRVHLAWRPLAGRRVRLGPPSSIVLAGDLNVAAQRVRQPHLSRRPAANAKQLRTADEDREATRP